MGQKSKTQNVTKLKLWLNLNWDKNQNSKCDKTQIVTKPKNSSSNKTQKLNLWQNFELLQIWVYKKETKTLKGSFQENIFTPWQLRRCSLGSVLWFFRFFYTSSRNFFFYQKHVFTSKYMFTEHHVITIKQKHKASLQKKILWNFFFLSKNMDDSCTDYPI